MPDTLSLTYDDLAGRTGLYLGYGRGTFFGDPAWDSYQSGVIQELVGSGLRNFYYPAQRYDWSFLRPVCTVEVPEGSDDTLLPQEFGGVEGEVMFSTSGQATAGWPAKQSNEGRILWMRNQQATTTGRPEYVAVGQPTHGGSADQNQRCKLMVWPTPDSDYTATLQYYVHPKMLSTARPYALGGQAHHETLLMSCLAAAELQLDNKKGVYAEQFAERMSASMEYDRKLKAKTVGYNGDGTGRQRFGRWPLPYWGWRVGYNGVYPEQT
jgi:hypothetical protein